MPANRTQRSTNSPRVDAIFGDTTGEKSPLTRLMLGSDHPTIRKCQKSRYTNTIDEFQLLEYGKNQSNAFLLELMKQKDDIQKKYEVMRMKYENLKGNVKAKKLKSENENFISETPDYS